MACLNRDFYKEKCQGPLTEEEAAVSYLIYKNSPNEDYNEAVKNDGRYFVKYNFSDYRQSALRWKTFKKGSSVLEIGASFGAMTGALCDACEKVYAQEPSLFKARLICERYASRDNLTVFAGDLDDIQFNEKFDYIVCFGQLECQSEPILYLNKLKGLLKDAGILLLEVQNQYGIQYLAGKKDSHSGIPFESLAGYSLNKNSGRAFNRAARENLFAKSSFSSWKFYYPMPDAFFPRALYTDQGLPSQNILERLVDCHEDTSTYVCDDRNLFVDAAANKAFHFVANQFIVELTGDKAFLSDAKQMTLSGGYRLRQKAFASIIREKQVVQKKCLYPQGEEYAKSLCKITEDFTAKGLCVLPMKIKDGSLYMDFVKAPTVSQHIKNLLDQGTSKEEIFKIFDILWNDIKRSSKTVDPSAFDSQGLDLGPILQKAYIEMAINNSFWLDGKLMYFDQEYVRENYPAKYVLYRSFSLLFGFIPEVFSVLKKEDLTSRYGITDQMFDFFFKMECELDRQENPYQYSIMNLVDQGRAAANRLKLVED